MSITLLLQLARCYTCSNIYFTIDAYKKLLIFLFRHTNKIYYIFHSKWIFKYNSILLNNWVCFNFTSVSIYYYSACIFTVRLLSVCPLNTKMFGIQCTINIFRSVLKIANPKSNELFSAVISRPKKNTILRNIRNITL